jgi:hypothetical protein
MDPDASSRNQEFSNEVNVKIARRRMNARRNKPTIDF